MHLHPWEVILWRLRCFSNREKWFWHKEGSQDYLNKQMDNSTPQVYIEHILTAFVSLLIFIHISLLSGFSLVQSLSRVQLTLCDLMDYSTPGFPVHHQLLEPTQTHVHHISDAIQPSHPLSSPSPPTFNLSASGSFLMSPFFTSGGQSIGVSASFRIGLQKSSLFHSKIPHMPDGFLFVLSLI